jgi:hypothetical protein
MVQKLYVWFTSYIAETRARARVCVRACVCACVCVCVCVCVSPCAHSQLVLRVVGVVHVDTKNVVGSLAPRKRLVDACHKPVKHLAVDELAQSEPRVVCLGWR